MFIVSTLAWLSGAEQSGHARQFLSACARRVLRSQSLRLKTFRIQYGALQWMEKKSSHRILHYFNHHFCKSIYASTRKILYFLKNNIIFFWCALISLMLSCSWWAWSVLCLMCLVRCGAPCSSMACQRSACWLGYWRSARQRNSPLHWYVH